MNKMEEIIAASKLGEMLQKKQQEEKKKNTNRNTTNQRTLGLVFNSSFRVIFCSNACPRSHSVCISFSLC